MRAIGILVFALLGVVPATSAQQEISYDSITDVHRFSIAGRVYDYRSDIQSNSFAKVDIKGSPFLFEKWQRSSVPTDRGNGVRFLLNYNITEDYVVISMGSVERIVFPESFVVNGRTFLRSRNQYFEVLYSGKKIKLLRRYNARLDKVERNGYNENVKYDYEYAKSEDLFLQRLDGNPVPIKLHERNLLSKLPNPKAARLIIQNHELNLRTESDVIVLLAKLED